MIRTRSRRHASRRGIAAAEMAVTLPLIMIMLTGLWEVARIVEVRQIITNAARVGVRQAATGQLTNAQIQQLVINNLNLAGLNTANAVVTVQDLTSPGTDVSQATSLDQLQVSISIPFKDLRWVALSLVTNDSTTVTSQATGLSLVDFGYPTNPPQPPQG